MDERMKGSNVFRMNKENLIQAIEFWLNQRVFTIGADVTVDDVIITADYKNGSETIWTDVHISPKGESCADEMERVGP